MTTLTNAAPPSAADTRSCEAAADALLKSMRNANPGTTVTGRGQTMVAGGNIVGCIANARFTKNGSTTQFDARIDLHNQAKPVAILGVTKMQQGDGGKLRTTSAYSADFAVNVIPGTPATAGAPAVPAKVEIGTEASNATVRDHANDKGAVKPLSADQLELMGIWHGYVTTFAKDAGLGLKDPTPAVPPVTIGRRAPTSP